MKEEDLRAAIQAHLEFSRDYFAGRDDVDVNDIVTTIINLLGIMTQKCENPAGVVLALIDCLTSNGVDLDSELSRITAPMMRVNGRAPRRRGPAPRRNGFGYGKRRRRG